MSADPQRTVGPYRLEALLGKGGMGEVYRAYDQRLDRRVAIKHVRPEAAGKPKSRERFRREAWMAARLSHPGLVQVFDILEEEDGDWIVMELIDGPSIAELLRDGPLEIDAVLAYGRRVAEALAEAHEKGIIHRDLKTENVMLTASGHAKLLDFGLAKPVFDGDLDDSISNDGEIKGTMRSMSPEQARGFEVDARSDLFSFGTMLYEMTTGVSPFRGRTATDTLSRVITHRQPPAREVDPSVPPALSALIDRLLEKPPELRPASAREVIDELERIAIEGGSVAPDPPAGETTLQQETKGTWASTPHSDTPSTAVIRTLLVTDLVDSTALFARLGDRRSAELSERHDAVARALLVEHHGREIDKSDGFLLLFERPVDAVAYALAYHRALAELSRETGCELVARAGIHLGEVFLRENPPEAVARGAKPLEVEGLAKATAARVMSLALGGQTLMTHGAYDLARRGAVGEIEDEDLRWIDHGAYRLKGVEDPVEVYEVGVAGFSPLVDPVNRTKAIRVAEPRLASGGSRGWAAPATATRAGTDRRWRLGALAAAGVMVVALVLIVAARRDTGGSSPGSEPATSLAAEGAAEAPTRDPYELYEQGMALLKRYDREGNIDNAIASFQRILAQNERSAPAHAGLAQAFWHKYNAQSRDRQLLEQGLAIAQRAVELDEHLAAARVALGLILTDLGRLDEARDELEQALALDPGSADAYWGIGRVREAQNALQAAETAYLRAIELDPSNFRIFYYLGSLYFDRDRYEDAEQSFLRGIELAPDFVPIYRNLSGIYFLQGRENEAASLLQKAITIQPDPSLYANLGTILFYQGLYSQAASTYEKAMASSGDASNRPLMWGNLGDAYRWAPDSREKAREAYQRAIQLVRDELATKPEAPELRSRLALYLAKRGDTGEALDVLRKLDADAQLRAYGWYRIAVAYEIVNERRQALAALERALRAGFSKDEVRRDPELLELRSDPAYHRLVMSLESGVDR